MLFGCICLPDFPVQAALRAGMSASFIVDAVAVLDGPESLLKVFACNEQARRAGIEIGMTKLQAEARPSIVLDKRVAEHEESAQAALLGCAYDFSPRLESTCPGTVLVDLTGAGRLLGSQQEMGRELAESSAACGFTAHIAIAANADTALHAARGFAGVTVIAEGEEAQRLACLPIEVLQPAPEILDTLDSWGIRSFQALGALPSVPLTERLGQPGFDLQRLARGEVRRELVPAECPPSFQESLELEEAVDLLEPLGFVLNRLLDELISRLQMRSWATDHVQIVLGLEVHRDRQLRSEGPAIREGIPGSTHQRTLKLPVPTQEPGILLKLVQLDLAAHPPPAPVNKITIEVFPARIRPTQAGLFQPLAPEPAKLEITLARLRAAVGEEDELARARVGFPLVMDSYCPDSFQVLPSSAEKQNRTDLRGIRECPPTPRLVLRRFRPPLVTRVECGPAPLAVIFNGAKSSVIQACGPWRSSGAWWGQNEQWQREEWDVAIDLKGSPSLYRIFRDLQSGQWFVEGMYD